MVANPVIANPLMTGDSWRTTGVRWLKFNAVGGIGIAVQLLVLAGLKSGFHFHYLIATALAVEAAVVHNYLWHERFTWADRTSGAGFVRFIKFNMTTGAFSIVGNVVLMKLLVGVLALHYLVANGITIAVCSIVNFAVSNKFVFRAKPQKRCLQLQIPSRLKPARNDGTLQLHCGQLLEELSLSVVAFPLNLLGCGRGPGARQTRCLPASALTDRRGPSNRRSGA